MSGKKYKAFKEKIRTSAYPLDEALKLVLGNQVARFDESVDVAVSLGVDVKKGDQQVRGAVALPHGLGRKVKVVVFAKGEEEEAAKKAGADFVGDEDLIEKIKSGWLDFDCVIATPDRMAMVSKIAKILGPRGLMPNPKSGTVTAKVGPAVKQQKKGMAHFRADKHGIVHSSIGRLSMGEESIKENFLALLKVIIKSKPSSSKGVYLKKVNVSSTMGPSVLADTVDIQNRV